MARVFLSSTWLDLQPERNAVEKVLHRLQEIDFVGMEYFGSRPESPHAVSLEEVDGADVYVGVFGFRPGSGITEAEYRRAREKSLPCFIYWKKSPAADESAPRDDDAEKQAALRRELGDSFHGHIITEFSNPDELAAAIAADLHNWLFRQYLTPEIQRAAEAGDYGRLRDLAAATRDRAALREALAGAGVAIGDDLLDGLLTLTGAKPINLFVEGVKDLPTDYAARIRNFLLEYLGTPTRPVPFGGRSEILEQLDAWRSDAKGAPYLLLTAEAGRGKSAVLVHWTRRLVTVEGLEVVFVPISIRFRTNLASVVFAALAARLAHLHGEPVPTDANTSAEVWRGLTADYLSRPLPNGKTLLVVLDGLDEAADWQAGADLFPRLPHPGLRVLVSARYTVSASDADAWREQLGWADPALARVLTLQPLGKAAVGDVLTSMGFPLAELGADVDIVAELYRISEGDPLVLGLLVTDLWSRGAGAAQLKPEDLRTIRPGLEGYFDRWWNDQRTLWGKDAPLRERSVGAILSILTCALGPLSKDSLLALAPAEVGLDSWTLEEAMTPLARFITGDGGESGFVLAHPKFALFLYDKLSERERRNWESLFLKWGAETLQQLEAGMNASDAPAYVVQHYGAHLERAHAGADALLDLLCEGWKRAWLALDAGYSGFANDIERAWRTCAKLDQDAVSAGGVAPRLDGEIYCALCRASIRSIARNIPPGMVKRLVELGRWKPAQALAYARQVPNFEPRVETLIRLVAVLPPAMKSDVEEEVLEEVRHIPPAAARARVYVTLLRHAERVPVQDFLKAVDEGTVDGTIDYETRRAIEAAYVALAERGELEAVEACIGRLGEGYERDAAREKVVWRLCELERYREVMQVMSAKPLEWGGRSLAEKLALHFSLRGMSGEAEQCAELAVDRRFPDFTARECKKLVARLAAGGCGRNLEIEADDVEWLVHIIRWRPFAAGSDVKELLRRIAGRLAPEILRRVQDGVYEPIENAPPVSGVIAETTVLLSLLLSDDERDAEIMRLLGGLAAAPQNYNTESDLRRLIPVLSKVTVSPAGEVARRVLSEDSAADLISAFAEAQLKLGCVEIARSLANSEIRPQQKAKTQARLLGAFPAGERKAVVLEILGHLAESTETLGQTRTEILETVSEHLGVEALGDALALATRIGDRAFVELASGVVATARGRGGTLDRLREVQRLSGGATTDDISQFAVALLCLFASREVKRELAHEILQGEWDVRLVEVWSFAIQFCCTALPIEERASIYSEAWRKLLRLGQGDGLSKLLKGIPWEIPPEVRAEVPITVLLERAEDLPDDYERQPIWVGLIRTAALSTGNVAGKARELLLTFLSAEKNVGVSSHSLHPLLAFAPPDLVECCRQVWLPGADEKLVVMAISVLAPAFAPDELAAALGRVWAFSGEERGAGLVALLPFLPPAEVDRILDYFSSRSEAAGFFPALAEYFVDACWQDRWKLLIRTLNECTTASQLEAFCTAHVLATELGAGMLAAKFFEPRLEAMDRPSALRIFSRLFDPQRPCTRELALLDLAAFLPIIVRLTDARTLGAVNLAVDRACRLFP